VEFRTSIPARETPETAELRHFGRTLQANQRSTPRENGPARQGEKPPFGVLSDAQMRFVVG
jgi:hypothetical protein